jgi:hypothetical protein
MQLILSEQCKDHKPTKFSMLLSNDIMSKKEKSEGKIKGQLTSNEEE